MIEIGDRVILQTAQHRELGLGAVLDVRGSQAKVEFRPTVFSTPPYITETRILDSSELKVIPSPTALLQHGQYDDTWKFELKQRAADLLVCNRDGQLSNARTDLLPHQITIAHEVISSPLQRFLIADDVGLGKTIEAGLIYYALFQRGQANRTLIVTPAGLTLQWQEEMKDKFDVDFAVYREDIQGPLAFEHNNKVITSIDTLKLDRPQKNGQIPGHKSLVLAARDWDLIIFDEAHKLSARTWSPRKIEKTHNYRLAEELRDHCQSMLLLTATPHQGEESKFRNLLKLLYERVTFDQWERQSPDAIPYTKLVLRNRKSKVTDAKGKPLFKEMKVHPVQVALLNTGERAFHKALESYLKEGYGYAEQDPSEPHRKAIGFVMTTFQKLAASSSQAIKHALEKRCDNLKRGVEKNAGWEEGEYDARCQGEADERAAAEYGSAFLQGELEIQWLNTLINKPVPEDGKADELIKVIDSLSQKELVLIFTEYRQTQTFLHKLLEERYGKDCVVEINGSMNLYEKRRSQERFRDDPRVRFLVSTEAGGEGVNLQFCHIEINYDLPWNPFRLAQRYGRLYRYGQNKVVLVFNFQNIDKIEEKIREYLERKTRTAAESLSKITGETPQEVEEGLLGLFEEYIDYEKIYRDTLVKGSIKPSQKVIDSAVKKAEEAYRLAYNSLFSKPIAPFNPERFKHEIQSPLTLVQVEEFVHEFVRRHGRNFNRNPKGYYEFLLPSCLNEKQDLKRRYENVTFNRKKAIRYSHLEFPALGHPFTDEAIRYCGGPDFGGFAALREVKGSKLAGTRGVQFNFLVKHIRRSEHGEQIFFDLTPVFLTPEGEVNEEAGITALRKMGTPPTDHTRFEFLHGLDIDALETKGRKAVLQRHPDETLWDEDLMLLNVAGVLFR